MGKLEDALASLGLTTNETKVYLALLQTGSTTSGALIEKTGLHIPRVYDALRGLQHKGLASYVLKNRKKFFEAASPARFLDLLEAREKEFKSALPQLLSLERAAEAKPEPATVFKGVRGIRSVLESILEELKHGGEYADFGVSGLFRQVMGPYWDAWQKSKKAWRIKSRCLFDQSIQGTELAREYFGEARFVPKEFHCPSDTMVFGDKIVIFAWTADPPTAVVVRDAATAKGYKNIFEWMWQNAAH